MMKYKKFFCIMLLMVLVASISSLTPSVFLLVWEQQGVLLSWRRIVFLISAIAGSKCLTICMTVFRERYAKNFNERNFCSMLKGGLAMDYDSLLTMGAANLLDRISGAVNSIYFYMTGDHIQLWASVVTLSGCLLLTGIINPWLALFLFAMLPVNYFGYRMLNKELSVRSRELSEKTSEGFQEILSYVQQVDYIKQSSNFEVLFDKLSPAIDKLYRMMAHVNVYAQSASAGLRGMNEVVQNLILMVIVYKFFSNDLGPYMLIMTSIILPTYFSNLGTIVGVKVNQSSFSVALDFQKDLQARQEGDGTKVLSEIIEIKCETSELEIQGSRIPFLAKCILRKGDIVQICGPSGCGKSSFAKALLKFRPLSGIWINEIPISELQNNSLRNRIEYLSQNVPIVKGTLRDNLFLNNRYSKDAEKRFLSEPILQSIFASKSMDTLILDGGANLSGGEKQKIALARALSQNTDVLILDEVCSNIDQEAADSIYACLKCQRAQRITIIISHDSLPDGFVNTYINQ